jgi:hypothetical protein
LLRDYCDRCVVNRYTSLDSVLWVLQRLLNGVSCRVDNMVNHFSSSYRSRALAAGAFPICALLFGFVSGTMIAAPQAETFDPGPTGACPTFPVVFQRVEGCGNPQRNIIPPPPLRVLGAICPPGTIEGDHCKGRFQILAGGAPATVKSFHTQTYESTFRGVSVFWTCPDKNARVLIVLNLNDYVWPAEAACDRQLYQWPADDFKGWSQKSVQPLVTVEVISDGTPCWQPILLLARLKVHRDSFRLAPSGCGNIGDASACLSIGPGSATNIRSWAIRLGGDTLDQGRTKMRTYLGKVPRSRDCRPDSVTVQIDSGAGSRITPIGEIRF